MKIIFISIFLFQFYWVSTYGQVNEETASINLNGNTYSIQAKSKWIASPGTFNNIRIDYTVKKDSQVIHSSPTQGGTLLGCSYGKRYTKEALPKNFIVTIKLNGKDIGWWVKSFSICGNTTSLRSHLVLPIPKKGLYAFFEVDSKTEAKILLSNNYKEIWFIYQEWGKGGTAGSFFVPRRYLINEEGGNFQSVPVGINRKVWPDLEIDYKTFSSIYVAGILDRDPKLMNYALEKYFREDKDSVETYKWVGLPVSKKEALMQIEAMSTLKDQLKVFSGPKHLR